MSTLIIAEKPSVGRDFAAALPGPFTEEKGYLESDDLIITWAVGHLLSLAEPETYDKKFKRWKLDDLPIIPAQFELTDRDSSGQLQIVLDQINRLDVTDIINGCDAGREGELIFAWLYQRAETSKPVKRMWLSSLTKKAILEAYNNLLPAPTGLEEAARCRAQADWLVGMNATRAATIHLRSSYDGAVSLGRVQTPTLAILAAREEEIKAFVSSDYWLVESEFTTDDGRSFTGKWHDQKEERILNQADADKIIAACEGQRGTIIDVIKKDRTEKPPLLHDLTSLSREAGGRFGFSAKRTSSAAQRLYEKHKAISYPRTSSRYLSADVLDDVPSIAASLTSQYGPSAQFVVNLPSLPTDRIIGKVSDHHALIPTGEIVASFGEDEKKIFDLIARRFLAVFHPSAEMQSTRIETQVKGETFYSRGSIMKKAGWKDVYDRGEDKLLPSLLEGEEVTASGLIRLDKQTQPPNRYSDASLLGAMETAGKEIDDEDAREAMKESGLGTPATRASIIETLISRDFIFREGRSLTVADKGLQLIRFLDDHPLTQPELTGQWEARLLEVENSKTKSSAFMKDIAAFSKTTIKDLDKVLAGVRVERASLGPCPVCGNEIKENRRAYSCWDKDDHGCGFVIWKKLAGKNLPEIVVRELVTQGKTKNKISGFKGKSGRSFSAHLAIVQNDEGVWQSQFNEEWAFQDPDAKKPAAKKPAAKKTAAKKTAAKKTAAKKTDAKKTAR